MTCSNNCRMASCGSLRFMAAKTRLPSWKNWLAYPSEAFSRGSGMRASGVSGSSGGEKAQRENAPQRGSTGGRTRPPVFFLKSSESPHCLSGFPHALERRRPPHSHPEAGQGGVCEAEMSLDHAVRRLQPARAPVAAIRSAPLSAHPVPGRPSSCESSLRQMLDLRPAGCAYRP